MLVDQPNVAVKTLRTDPVSPVIAISGELDLASVELVEQALGSLLAGPEHVTFDLAELTFMDSSGIAFFVRVANDVGSVTLTQVTPLVHRVLETTGLLEFFGLTD